MEYIKDKKNINTAMIILFVGICVFIPGDIYSIKKVVFAIILLYNIKLLMQKVIKDSSLVYVVYSVIFPIALILYSTLITGNVFSSISRSFAPLIFLVIIVIKYYKIDYERIILIIVFGMALMTILFAIFDFAGLMNVNYGFVRDKIFYRYDIGLMGKSPSYPMYYKIFFKTSPLIVLLLFKMLSKKKYAIAVLAMAALLLSGTRANILFPLIFAALYYIINPDKKYNNILVKFMVGLILVLGIGFVLPQIVNLIYEIIIEKGQVSNDVRIGHIQGIIELVRHNPLILVFGSGMGSEFFSYGSNSMVSSIEWSFIDLWRQMGVFFFLTFLSFVILPFFYTNESGSHKKYAYISYLCISATNPLLFSSTSYLVFMYIYLDIIKKRRINKNENEACDLSQTKKNANSFKVDIVLATYKPNVVYFKKLLESIDKQTYKNIQLIVRDDSADCHQYEIVCDLLSKHIKTLPYRIEKNEINLGSNKTFELLTREATGDYIAYCDQDDIWEPNKIEVLVNEFSKNNICLCYSDLSVIDQSDQMIASSFKRLHKRLVHVSGEGLFKTLLMRNSVTGCAMIIKRSVAQASLPFPNEYFVHDHWLALYASSQDGSIGYVSKPLINYRIHDGNQIGATMLNGITNRKDYIEKKLYKEKEKYKMLLERFDEGSYDHDQIKWASRWIEDRIHFFETSNLKWFLRVISKLRVDWQIVLFEVTLRVLPSKMSEKLLNRVKK